MADLNEVRLIGRLTREPSLRMTPNGQHVATLGLATNRRYKDQTGVLREETTFVDITCWGKLAETTAKYMHKGRQIFVGGRLKLDTWDDKQTGQKRSKLSVVADNVQFLDRKDEGAGAPPPVDEAYPYPSEDWGSAPASGPVDSSPSTWPSEEPQEPPF